MVVLDTSFLIAIERQEPEALELYQAFRSGPVPLRVPAAVWIEYLFPFAPRERARAGQILDDAITFEPFSRVLADLAARLQHDLHAEGRPLAWHDLQIAATAIHHGEDLVTQDTKFGGIPGLGLLAF